MHDDLCTLVYNGSLDMVSRTDCDQAIEVITPAMYSKMGWISSKV